MKCAGDLKPRVPRPFWLDPLSRHTSRHRFASSDPAQLPHQVPLRRIRPALVILVLVFALDDLRLGDEGVIGPVRHGKKHERGAYSSG